MTSDQRLMHALGTLLRASLAGGVVASVGGFLVPAFLDASGAVGSRMSQTLWGTLFVFMITLTEYVVITILLLGLLATLRRLAPALVARELVPTVLCMTLGAAIAVGQVYLFAAMLPSSRGADESSSGTSILLLFLAIGGAVAGMIVARREAPPRPSGR